MGRCPDSGALWHGRPCLRGRRLRSYSALASCHEPPQNQCSLITFVPAVDLRPLPSLHGLSPLWSRGTIWHHLSPSGSSWHHLEPPVATLVPPGTTRRRLGTTWHHSTPPWPHLAPLGHHLGATWCSMHHLEYSCTTCHHLVPRGGLRRHI
jgi:hypothetical protein